MADQPGYTMPTPGFGAMQQPGYQTPEEQAKQEQDYARAEAAQASSQIANATAAAKQQVAAARESLERQREQARAQLKEQELAVMAEEKQKQLEYARLQQMVDNESAAYSLQLQQVEEEVAKQDEMGARIRVASTRAVAPWTRADLGTLTPPPLPVRR